MQLQSLVLRNNDNKYNLEKKRTTNLKKTNKVNNWLNRSANITKNIFLNRVVAIWNSLTDEVVSVGAFSRFKSSLHETDLTNFSTIAN